MTIVVLALFGLLFGGGEEKDLQQLHATALHAWQCREYDAAEEAYEEILGKISPPYLSADKLNCDWQTYIDIVLRYSDVLLALNKPLNAQTLLQELLDHHPPPSFVPQLTISVARCLASLGQNADAYLIVRKLEEKWQGNDLMFFHALEYLLNDQNDELLQKAKRFCLAGNYLEGAKIYEQLLHTIEIGAYPKAALHDAFLVKKVRYKLAESYFHAAQFDRTLAVINKGSNTKSDSQMLYLAAVAYREKAEFEKAIECFQEYCNSKNSSELVHYDEALFEIGLNFYQNAQFEKAKDYFLKIYQNQTLKKVYFLSALYLGKIYLKIDSPEEGEKILSQSSLKMDKQHPLLFELNYLRGECAFACHNYPAAISFFEKCKPAKSIRKDWEEILCFKLALSYMSMAELDSCEESYRSDLFEKAGNLLSKLASLKSKTLPAEKITLTQARLSFIKNKFLDNPLELTEMEDLFRAQFEHFSLEAQVEALLTIAIIQPSYDKRALVFDEACSECYATTPLYPECWAQRATNDFNQALMDKEKKEALFAQAIAGFEKSFSLFEGSNQKRAAEVLHLEAKAHFYSNTPLKAFSALDCLLSQFSLLDHEKQEALYIKGLIALHLNNHDAALECLTEAATLFPEEKYADGALHALATLYFQRKDFQQAKIHFDELYRKYPHSKYAADALYWQAEALEKLHLEPSLSVALRAECYTHYPKSPLAPQAYFKCFTIEDYSQGKEEALQFLKHFEALFPASPLLTAAYYFLAENENDFSSAKIYYEKALKAFENHYTQAGDDPSFIYYRYKSMLSLASLYVKREMIQEHLQAAYLLHSIVQEFEDAKNPLSSACNHPEIYEESQFSLGCCYIKLGKEEKGREIFLKMLAQYDKAGVKQGFYLAHVWENQGKLSLANNDFDTALECLKMAYISGKQHLSPDERLTIWLLESEVYRKQNKLDLSMRMLSKIINEDVVSPLRLKAMYQRAEIYELEGRLELAVRQLEAMAKTDDEWGHLAKDKLRIKYGME